MPDTILGSVTQDSLTLGGFLLCTAVSLVLGVGVGLIYMYRNNVSKNLFTTLALLPAMVQVVIMLVNGNIGAGVAVMGAFSLVRFRSIPGSAREIGSIFLAMALGLATGMGYLVLAAVFLIIIGAASALLSHSRLGDPKTEEKLLKITIPENLDYDGMFDDLFAEYTGGAELMSVKTTNMGSLYELTYHVRLRTPVVSKEFLDKLRCRNGNLKIACGKIATPRDEL